MEKQSFERAKDLTVRISNLKLIKAYLTCLLIDEPLAISITVRILSTNISYPIFDIGRSVVSEKISKTEGKDYQFLVDAIDGRIIELEREFNQL
jgi:hypothetical protein